MENKFLSEKQTIFVDYLLRHSSENKENLPSINRLLHHLNEVLPSNKALTKCEYEKNTTSWIIEIEPSLLDKERDAILEHLWRKLRSHFISIKP